MKRSGVSLIIGVIGLLLLVGCVQNSVPSGGKTMKVTVPNLMSG
jgi:hypothetical protein